MDPHQAIVNEILELGAQKRRANERLGQLEIELFGGSTLGVVLRTLFSTESRRKRREEFDNIVRTIEGLRARMDHLRASLPTERWQAVDHLWSIENTTSHSQLRASSKKKRA